MPRDALQTLLAWPRVPLGTWPTPVEEVPGFPPGTVLVKRDDLSGYGRGGVKARKLESLLGHLEAGDFREVVTGVGNVTNLAFDLAPALRQRGIGLRLFVLDDPPLPLAERRRLFAELGDAVILAGSGQALTLARMLARLSLGWLAGRRTLLVLPSLAHPSAVVGVARGFVEMVRQLQAAGRPLPATVYISSASGTTHAGLVLGEYLLRRAGTPPIEVVGCKAAGGPTRWLARFLLRWTESVLDRHVRAVRVPEELLQLRTEHAAGGFGRFTPQQEALCTTVAARHGLRLDPVYGAKVWSVLQDDLARQAPTPERPVLFWHCGYSLHWEQYLRASD